MSVSTTSRIKRGRPRRQFTDWTYRQAKPFLLRDFKGRCAYSLQHVERVGSRCIEVDHFNPNLRGLARNKYRNLFPATRHCNGSKSDIWPERALQRAGVRFLDPTKELDYGVHIFEDPHSHVLAGVTPQGRFHIRCCDLNAPHLVNERSERAMLRKLLDGYGVMLKVPIGSLDGKDVLDPYSILRAIVDRMIPAIPSPPATESQSA